MHHVRCVEYHGEAVPFKGLRWLCNNFKSYTLLSKMNARANIFSWKFCISKNNNEKYVLVVRAKGI